MERQLLENLTNRTGDPFADTGAWIIEILHRKNPERTILEHIEEVAKIYALDWDGKINAFFLNSTITHHSRKGMEKVKATVEYYKSLLDGTLPGTEGYCRLLGIKTRLFPAGRDNNILCGSSTFINFHHGFQQGVMLSKEALIRIFFVPLGAVTVGNLIAVINSNQTQVEKWFVENNYDENAKRIGNRTSEGVLSSQFKNPANALFDFSKYCIDTYAGQIPEDEPVEINLYHFSNFGAEPKIALHRFSAALFAFYQKVLNRKTRRDWERFVNSFYRQKSSQFEEGAEHDFFVITDKKDLIRVDEAEFRTWYNPVYSSLLKGDSILNLFKFWAKNQYLAHKPFKINQIIHLYQTILKGMRDETLKKIESIAEFIVDDPAKRKRRLNKLRLAKPGADFRNFLISLIRENVEKKSTKPLVTLREYVDYLFPDGTYGTEIRDLLLISVYEKLCEAQAFEDLDEVEDEITIDEETELN